MRADRLVAILLMLQRRDRVTAAEVAEELEISERTARRDLDALGMAGVPVYSKQGRGGGWQLLGGARTDLSGLTAREARALFSVAGPASGTTPEVRAALRKLVRALPEPFRATAEAASRSVVVDTAGWDESPIGSDPEHLDGLQIAVVEGCQVRLGYRSHEGRTTERTVHPLGLARKGRVWYLLADTDAGPRTFRVDRVRGVEHLDAAAVRPDGFDLEAEWARVVDRVDEMRTQLRCQVLVHPRAVGSLRWIMRNRVRFGGPGDGGRIHAEVRGHGIESLAADLAGFGHAVEVLDHPELRDRLSRLGHELVELYG